MTLTKGGRPTIYTPELAEEICSTIGRSSKGIKRLCEAHTHWPSSFTIFKWLRDNEEFSHQYVHTKMIQVSVLMDEIINIADEAKNVRKASLAINVRKWIACKLMPKVYGNKIDARVDVGMSHDDWVMQMHEEKYKNKDANMIKQ